MLWLIFAVALFSFLFTMTRQLERIILRLDILIDLQGGRVPENEKT
ncbi:hypothetical protein [Corynebacterium gerontici]|uniref:Uncharacterized protein n=1 Tax=Corynebacterium gerontici TaxID=2079234 RepID=A0A3G6J8S4_9CORY|nr:hypothetical protein [Corynebacterium gerontici]AZA12424.1 hypothetical protein CGERO_10725 [Corynebacterium gerontici]